MADRRMVYGMMLGVFFGSILGYKMMGSLLLGEYNIPKNKLEVYECFQAIRDSEDAKWMNFYIREDFDKDIFGLARVISSAEVYDDEWLKGYELRNLHREGLKSVEKLKNEKVSHAGEIGKPWIKFHYKNRFGYVHELNEKKELYIFVNLMDP